MPGSMARLPWLLLYFFQGLDEMLTPGGLLGLYGTFPAAIDGSRLGGRRFKLYTDRKVIPAM